MSQNDPQSEYPLQFDTAEYSTPQTTGTSCSICSAAITQTYYTLVNSAKKGILCEACQGQLNAILNGGSKYRRAFAATALGLLAGIAGATIWYGVRVIAGYEIGLIAIGVGLMVGVAVRKGSQGRGGWFYQTLAILITYSCISAQYIPDIVSTALDKQPAHRVGNNAGNAVAEEPADAPANFGIMAICLLVVIAFVLSLAVPILGATASPIGLLIVGFALYEAWKINKRSMVQIAGPFQMGVAAATRQSN